jgi:cardiolipin synthase (CMP-forming)
VTADTGEAARDEGLDRLLTVPNALSLARLGLLAWFLLELFDTTHRVLAAVLLGLAGSTDFLDGYVARRLHQVSSFGKLLDPTVDRVVVTSSIIACTVYGAVPWWFASVVVGRELVTAGVLSWVALARGRRIDVIFLGKAGTFGLMWAFPFLLASDGPGGAWHAVRIGSWVVALTSLGVAFAASARYVPIVRRALREVARDAADRPGVPESGAGPLVAEGGAH